MKKQQVELRQGSLDKFLSSKVVTVCFIVSTTVAVIMFFLGPSMTNKTALQLQEQRIVAQRETIDSLTKTQQNDTQEVKLELSNLNDKVEDLETNMAQLITIINERIPAKK